MLSVTSCHNANCSRNFRPLRYQGLVLLTCGYTWLVQKLLCRHFLTASVNAEHVYNVFGCLFDFFCHAC